MHDSISGYASSTDAKQGIANLPLATLRCRVVSAHVIGGCAMADAPDRGVVNHESRNSQSGNLSTRDGPLFLTSIGANPQRLIHDLVARHASLPAAALSGRQRLAILREG